MALRIVEGRGERQNKGKDRKRATILRVKAISLVQIRTLCYLL